MPDITPMTDAELEDTRKNARSRFDPTLRLLATIDALKKALAEHRCFMNDTCKRIINELRSENECLREDAERMQAIMNDPELDEEEGYACRRCISFDEALNATAAERKEKG